MRRKNPLPPSRKDNDIKAKKNLMVSTGTKIKSFHFKKHRKLQGQRYIAGN
jgi:hypothetical protein